jgi:hypothetical protein
VLPRAGKGNRDSTVSGVESSGNYGAATLSMKVGLPIVADRLVRLGLEQ